MWLGKRMEQRLNKTIDYQVSNKRRDVCLVDMRKILETLVRTRFSFLVQRRAPF